MIAIMVVMALLLSAFPMTDISYSAKDDGGIEVQSQIGYSSYSKDSKWNPLKLTLTNKTKEAVEGDVVVSTITREGITNDIVVPVELPMDTAVKVSLALPSGFLSKDTSRIRFFEGSYKSGKEVRIIGQNYLSKAMKNSYSIGVVSRDPDTLNFMPSLNQKGYSIDVVPITIEDLPADALLLDSIDTLVINDVDSGEWDKKVVKAIQDWVTKGGSLVLSGGAGYASTAKAFKEIAPIEANGTTELKSTESMAAIGDAELKLDQPITLSNGNVVAGDVLISESDVPIAVENQFGFGSVIYVAYDPSLEPMSTWSGNANLWSRLLQRNLIRNQNNQGGYVQIGSWNGSGDAFQNIKYVIDQFPSIKAPRFALLLGMFVLYMLLVAPVLYFILRKTDRREWAWWMIPTFSIIMGITIFYIGAEDKRAISAHTIELIEASNDGKVVVSGGTGLFIPTGGTVTASFSDKRTIQPYADDVNGFVNGALLLDGKYQFKSGEEESIARWESVPYWSTRKLWMERRVVDSAETGLFSVKYEQKDGKTLINVTNNTIADLTNVSLIMNGHVVRIGDLKKGENGAAARPSGKMAYSNNYSNYSDFIFSTPSTTGRQEDKDRERNITDNYFGHNNGMSTTVIDPVIVGYSIDHESQYEVDGKKVKSDNLKMWIQKLDSVEKVGNKVVVSAGTIQPIITSHTLKTFTNYGSNVQGSNGELIIEYLVPNVNRINYDKINVQFDINNRPDVSWTIWNEASGQWNEINDSLKVANDYLVKGGSIRIKASVTNETGIIFPQIVLEGEEKQQ